MNEALIAAGATLLVCLINNIFQEKRYMEKSDETISLVTYRLQQLEKKQDKHNCLIERVYDLETQLAVEQEKIDVANHRINDLEEFHK